jgi:hypothetical protein
VVVPGTEPPVGCPSVVASTKQATQSREGALLLLLLLLLLLVVVPREARIPPGLRMTALLGGGLPPL